MVRHIHKWNLFNTSYRPGPNFKDKILQTDTRHYYDHLPMPKRFNPRHDWVEQFGLHKVAQFNSTGLIWLVSFVISLFWPFFPSDFLLSAPIGWARRSKLKQHQVLVPCSPLGSSVNIGNFCFFFCNILQLSNDSNDWSRSCHFHGCPGTVGGGTHGARAAGGLVLVLVLSSAPVALIWSCL